MDDDGIVASAISILEKRIRSVDLKIERPEDVSDYLRLRMGAYTREVFSVFFLNTRHQLIEFEDLFFGTIDGAHVYPREVARRALQLNASAVVLVHNHPSGVAEPSRSDEVLTGRLKDCLALFEIRVLDHFVVTAGSVVSLAQRGAL